MSSSSALESEHREERHIWYRTTLFNAFVIGAVGFLAPGLWNAMSSLGAGGAQSPFLVNAANALVFGLSCVLFSDAKEVLTGVSSGNILFAWWSYCKSHWFKLDLVPWSCRVSHLCVRVLVEGIIRE